MSHIQTLADNPLLLIDSAITPAMVDSNYWCSPILFHTYARSTIEVMRNIERDCVTDKLTWQFAQYYNYPWKDDCILIRRYREQFSESIIQFVLNKAQTVAHMLYNRFTQNIYPCIDSTNFGTANNKWVLLSMSPAVINAITNYARSHKFFMQRSAAMNYRVDSDLLYNLNEVSKSAQEIDLMVRNNYYSFSNPLNNHNDRTAQFLPLDVIKLLMTPNTFLDPANKRVDFSKTDQYLSNVRYTANVLSILYHLIGPDNADYSEFTKVAYMPLQGTYDKLMHLLIDNYRVNTNKALQYSKHYADGTNAFVIGMPMNSRPIDRDCGELDFIYPDSDIEKYVTLRHCFYQYHTYKD